MQAVERRGDRNAALALFDQAVNLSPDNALVRYRRAKIYISMKQYQVGSILQSSTLHLGTLALQSMQSMPLTDPGIAFPPFLLQIAITDLEYLRSTSPEESNVIFQLAKVYRLVGDEVKGAQLLAIARDISPKSINKIKKLLETVKDELGDDKMDEG